jgi:hypothetical protein
MARKESLFVPFFRDEERMAASTFFSGAMVFEEVFDAHDHDLRLATPVYDEARILRSRAPHDLAKLRPSREGGNDFRNGIGRADHELIN